MVAVVAAEEVAEVLPGAVVVVASEDVATQADLEAQAEAMAHREEEDIEAVLEGAVVEVEVVGVIVLTEG